MALGSFFHPKVIASIGCNHPKHRVYTRTPGPSSIGSPRSPERHQLQSEKARGEVWGCRDSFFLLDGLGGGQKVSTIKGT